MSRATRRTAAASTRSRGDTGEIQGRYTAAASTRSRGDTGEIQGRYTAAASTRSRQEPSLSPPTATTMLPWVGPGQGTVRVRVKVEVRLMVRVRFRLRSSVLTLPRAMAARSWSALAEQRRSWRSAALARCSAFCSAWQAGQGAATSGGGGMVSGEPQHVCWQALWWQALWWQALWWQALWWQAWAGQGLGRGWADAWLSHLQEPLRL